MPILKPRAGTIASGLPKIRKESTEKRVYRDQSGGISCGLPVTRPQSAANVNSIILPRPEVYDHVRVR
jgi:hypothetical protein